jgi:hypothetical protein
MFASQDFCGVQCSIPGIESEWGFEPADTVGWFRPQPVDGSRKHPDVVISSHEAWHCFGHAWSGLVWSALMGANGVDEILHAGDVGDQEVLAILETLAPVRAVRGNVDGPDLPESLEFELAGQHFAMAHGHLFEVKNRQTLYSGRSHARSSARGDCGHHGHQSGFGGFKRNSRGGC